MAAKLQCEICGGKLIGKPGGIFLRHGVFHGMG